MPRPEAHIYINQLQGQFGTVLVHVAAARGDEDLAGA